MPTYEYACEKCGHRFEQFQSITAKTLRKCPSCGKTSLRRLMGIGAGIIFKGSGFYATDYRSDNYQQGKKAEESGTGAKAKDSGETGGGKTESSAKKTESKDSSSSAPAPPPAPTPPPAKPKESRKKND